MQQVEKGVFVRGVLVCVFAVCVFYVGLVVLRARASHLAHTLTHVGTVDDGRPQGVNLPHPSVLFCLLPSLCVGWCLVVVVVCVCVWVVCGGLSCCRQSRVVCAYMCCWCAGWSGV